VSGAAPPVGLYVHVPFCVSLCPYCDFVVLAGAAARGPRARVAAYLEALAVELELRADALDAAWGPPGVRPPLRSLYLGGGTPSLLPADAIAGLVARVRTRFGLAPGAEVTLEVNPGPDDRGDPVGQRVAGVTRLSLGAQSLVPAELRWLGRRHGPDDVAVAVRAARVARIDSIGIDLLYDVPGQTAASWASTLETAVALEPDHLSLYALTLDDPDADGLTGPGGDHLSTTPGARRWRTATRGAQDEDRAADAYLAATERLAAAGYRGYEISNWARPGHESRHNLAYWERLPVEAIGLGAHAFDGTTRRWSAAALEPYLAALRPVDGARPRLPPGGAIRPTAVEAEAERIVLGLRLDAGVPVDLAARPPLRDAVAWAEPAGLVERVGDRLRLTTRGRLLSNEVFARIV
jgi:oxygen-independent coproporphyrinogen-3 oxidase